MWTTILLSCQRSVQAARELYDHKYHVGATLVIVIFSTQWRNEKLSSSYYWGERWMQIGDNCNICKRVISAASIVTRSRMSNMTDHIVCLNRLACNVSIKTGEESLVAVRKVRQLFFSSFLTPPTHVRMSPFSCTSYFSFPRVRPPLRKVWDLRPLS